MESTIGALPTITNYRVKSENITPTFKEPTRPPVYLYLYYLDNPRKLFSVEEYHYENHKAILLLPVIFSPVDFGVSCDVPFEHPVANKVESEPIEFAWRNIKWKIPYLNAIMRL